MPSIDCLEPIASKADRTSLHQLIRELFKGKLDTETDPSGEISRIVVKWSRPGGRAGKLSPVDLLFPLSHFQEMAQVVVHVLLEDLFLPTYTSLFRRRIETLRTPSITLLDFYMSMLKISL